MLQAPTRVPNVVTLKTCEYHSLKIKSINILKTFLRGAAENYRKSKKNDHSCNISKKNSERTNTSSATCLYTFFITDKLLSL